MTCLGGDCHQQVPPEPTRSRIKAQHKRPSRLEDACSARSGSAALPSPRLRRDAGGLPRAGGLGYGRQRPYVQFMDRFLLNGNGALGLLGSQEGPTGAEGWGGDGGVGGTSA